MQIKAGVKKEERKQRNMKLAVIFPGVGYHTDKPLLYYSKKLAAAYGYEILEAEYGALPKGVKGDPEKMTLAFQTALAHTQKQLDAAGIRQYDEVLFIAKSIGTMVATACAETYQIRGGNVFFTPVNETFSCIRQKGCGIVFHGTKDNWARTDLVSEQCEALKLPLYLTKEGNHSLETGDVMRDVQNLAVIMEQVKDYISKR